MEYRIEDYTPEDRIIGWTGFGAIAEIPPE